MWHAIPSFHYSNLNGPLLRYIHPVIFAKQASTITIPQTTSMQDSQNAKKQFGPELYSYSSSCMAEDISLGSRDWLGGRGVYSR